jgi:hypothetical protein
VLAVLLAGEVALLGRWSVLPVSPQRVALLPALVVVTLLAAALAVRLASCLTMHFMVDDCALTIVRGTARWVVPLAAIESVDPGQAGAVLADRLLLPGFFTGSGYIKDGGPALFFCTGSPRSALSVRTATCSYVLAPQQPERFAASLDRLRGDAVPATAVEPGPGLLQVLLEPPATVLVGLAALANLGLYALVAAWYADPVAGALVSVPVLLHAGMPGSLFWLPVAGSLMLATDLLVCVLPQARRAAAYLLLVTSFLAQVLLWLAFLTMWL